MKKPLIAIAAAITLGACSTPPKPAVPDGSSRASVNSQDTINAYNARTAEETASRDERTVLSRQVDSLNKQVAELKTYLVLLQMERESNRPKERAAAHPPLSKKTTQPPLHPRNGESLEVRDRSVIFRVTHPFGKTEFAPSLELQEKLLKGAREAKRIDIRGRTDAAYDNPGDRQIALQRALHARRFLIANGVSPDKIRAFSLAANDYLTDNTTIEGRAKNRRVEIEMTDIDASAFDSGAQFQVTLGRAQ